MYIYYLVEFYQGNFKKRIRVTPPMGIECTPEEAIVRALEVFDEDYEGVKVYTVEYGKDVPYVF